MIIITKFIVKQLHVMFIMLFLSIGLTAQENANEFDSGSNSIPDAISSENVISPKTVIADFEADKTVVFKNSVVKFTNLSTGGATYFKWTIPGASPKTTTHHNPTAMYHTPGVYDVTLLAIGMSGSNTITKENYIEVVEEESNLPPGWNYENTPSQQVVAIPLEVNPRIFETPVDSGDFIGVFYFDAFYQLKCAGATQWTGTGNAMLVVNGDNSFTPMKDGFYPGEAINWRIFSNLKGEDFPAKATWDYSFPTWEIFIPNGISALTDLFAGVVWELQINEGWSAISSPVEPWYKQMDEIFGNSLTGVSFMQNQTGIYYPAGNINTIGNWQNDAILIKTNTPISFPIKGYPMAETEIQINAGWNFIHIPVSCQTSVSALFNDHSPKVVMIKEVAGLKSYYPEKEIFTLESLLPGKAYLLEASENFLLQFDNCE